jgi:hypothetical protein
MIGIQASDIQPVSALVAKDLLVMARREAADQASQTVMLASELSLCE